jgi:hypothetical protein
MSVTQIDQLNDALHSRGLGLAANRAGQLRVRTTGKQRKRAAPLSGHRERDWLVLEASRGRQAGLPDLRTQSVLHLCKYALDVPGAPPRIRADLPLLPEVLNEAAALQVLLGSVLRLGEPPSAKAAPAMSPEEMRAVLCALGEVEPVEDGLRVTATPGTGRPRAVAVRVEPAAVRFSLPLAGPADLDERGSRVLATHLMCLNATHYLARLGVGERNQPVAEVLVPAGGLTPWLCRAAVEAILNVIRRERSITLLLREAPARELYATYYGL